MGTGEIVYQVFASRCQHAADSLCSTACCWDRVASAVRLRKARQFGEEFRARDGYTRLRIFRTGATLGRLVWEG